jgi:hypothetical protein
MATYPEHEKLTQIRDKSQLVGEFLDWLSQQGYYICRWQDEGDNGQPKRIPATADDIARIHEDEYLADFFGIDQDKLEEEKRAMLDALRASYAEQDAA